MADSEFNIVFQPMPQHWRFTDLTGQKFGRLTVLGYAGRSNTGRNNLWVCECECGVIVTVLGNSLKSKSTKSCGCLRTELQCESNKRFQTHGETTDNQISPEYQAYTSAKQRCNNRANHAFTDYGGRGIEFRFNSFEEFLVEVGRRPSIEHSLDRIDNNSHYETGNLRWATRKQQCRNRRQRR